MLKLFASLLPDRLNGVALWRGMSRRADGTRFDSGIKVFQPQGVTQGRPPLVDLTAHVARFVERVVEIAAEIDDPAVRAQASAFRGRVEQAAKVALAEAIAIEAARCRLVLLWKRLPLAGEVVAGGVLQFVKAVKPLDELVDGFVRRLATFAEHADPVLRARAARFKRKLTRAARAALYRATVSERERVRLLLVSHGMPEAAALIEEG